MPSTAGTAVDEPADELSGWTGESKTPAPPSVSRLDPELTRLSPGPTGAATDFFLGHDRTNRPPVVNTMSGAMQLLKTTTHTTNTTNTTNTPHHHHPEPQKSGKPPKSQMRQLHPHPEARL